MYLALERLTEIRHALDQLCEVLTHVGGNESLHAGVYEPSRKQFKAIYVLSSRRKRSFINEVVAMQNSMESEAPNTFVDTNCLERRITGSAKEAHRMRLTVLARSSAKRTLFAPG